MVFCAHLLCVHGWVPISSFLGPWSVGHKELRSGCSIVLFSRKAKIGSPFFAAGSYGYKYLYALFSINVYIVSSTSLYFCLLFFFLSSCVVRLLIISFWLVSFVTGDYYILVFFGSLCLGRVWSVFGWSVGGGGGGLVGVEEGRTG